MWVHWLNLNTALTFLLVVQPKHPNSANWQHCPRLPTASKDNPNQWSLRACYYARVRDTRGVPLKSTSDSGVLAAWPAEVRTFSSESAALAAAPRFQQYLNSSERKAAPKTSCSESCCRCYASAAAHKAALPSLQAPMCRCCHLMLYRYRL